MVTPAGVGVGATWDRLCSGDPTVTHDPLLDGLPVTISAQVADADLEAVLDPGLAWRTDRFARARGSSGVTVNSGAGGGTSSYLLIPAAASGSRLRSP
jgi:hypothetical protein